MSPAPKCSFCDQPSIITVGMAGPGAGTLQEIHCGSDDCREREREAREAFDEDCDVQQQEDATHPAALAFHALNNAAQIARGLSTSGDDGGSVDEDGARIVELLVDAGRHGRALCERLVTAEGRIVELIADKHLRDELLAALEEDKRELLDDGLRQAKTIERLEATDTENKQRLCEAQKKAEDLTRDMAGALTEITELFNRARGIQLYHRAPAQPHGVTIHEAPRMAAGRS